VCGIQVDPAKAAGTSQVSDKIYYFCSKGCKAKFDADPKPYIK
jgi:P-type Cu+ transporter